MPFTGKIDVKNFNGGHMKVKNSYEVRILNYTGCGMWEVKGANISGEKFSNSIMITPSVPGTLILRYVVEGKTVTERTIPVEG